MPFVLAAMAVVGIAVIVFGVIRIINGSGETSAASAPVSTTSTSPSTTSTTTRPTTSTTSASPTSTASPTTAADAAIRSSLQSCVDRQNAAKGIVDAIATGAGHWSDHVQGETDLESGARSYIDVKTNTWGPTRAAGPADIAAFQAAQAAYAGAPACTPNAPQQPASADLMAKMQACAAREQALDSVVATGTKVMGDWGNHLSEMANHADGHVAGPDAQAAWIKRYTEAPTNLNPYKAAAAAYGSAPACSA